MVVQPFSPPILPSHYPLEYTFFPSPSSDCNARKRKRIHRDDEASIVDEFQTQHISKKQRDEYTPLTPTSPSLPLYPKAISPPSSTSQDIYPSHSNTKDITNNYHPEPIKLLPSDAPSCIPSHNLLLRDIHLNSRVYQQNQKQMTDKEDEEMWEEEEEVVAERYAAMNKLLGSRRMHR